MTLEEIKTIAETWFEWPSDDRYHVTYTSAMLFARDMYEAGQASERKRIRDRVMQAAVKSWHGVDLAIGVPYVRLKAFAKCAAGGKQMNKPKFTPGPWGWFGDPKHGGFYLATRHSGRRYVMGFGRMGLHFAQPLFQVEGVMVDAKELCRFEVAPDVVGMTAAKLPGSGVYRHDIIGLDHPDASLIAAAPELYDALLGCAFLLRAYEDHHLAKGDTEKAYRNRAYAEVAEAALKKARGLGNEN